VGTGNILIKDSSNNVVETIAVDGPQVTGTGTNIITINPSLSLPQNTDLYIEIADTAFDDLAGNSYAGIIGTGTWNFKTEDTTAPLVIPNGLSPADNANGILIDSNLVLTFDEDVVAGTGNIVIKQTSDNSIVETIAVDDSIVTISGSVVTINPVSDLPQNTELYIQVSNSAFDDLNGNSFIGILDTSTWNFKTMDNTLPGVISNGLLPADDANGVLLDSNLVMTFSKIVDVETGNIEIKYAVNNSVVETISVTSPQVSGTGTNEITINPTFNFLDNTDYYVQIDPTAFDDVLGNSYTGILDTLIWNFQTIDLSVITPSSINFVDPTPSDGTIQMENSIYVNYTVDGSTNLYSFIDFDDSLVLWMRMDDTDTSGNPLDLSDFNNDGFLVDNAQIVSTGVFGESVEFDGDGDGVRIFDSNSLDLSSEMTISAWVNNDRDQWEGSRQTVVSKWGYSDLVKFSSAGSWASYDASANGVGSDPDGYSGAVFDGRYVYFIPLNNGLGFHGEVLRYDTHNTYDDENSWDTFDPGSNGVGSDPDGYSGAVFDGKYIYFVPFNNGLDYHGEVLRYDTQSNFDDESSWLAFDAGANGVGSDPRGFIGAVFDGKYVYFVPNNNGLDYHGEVLRYDTQNSFDDVSSWLAFDAGANGVGSDPDGYAGAVFDGKYVYFVPFNNGLDYHGEVLRFDTQSNFDDVSSWASYDPGSNGVGSDPRGFIGAVFDGKYVYFVPNNNGVFYHGEVLRFDTQNSFDDVSSWLAFDAGANGVGSDPDGYAGAVFDGRHIYFSPKYNGVSEHGEVLRFDTQSNFDDENSWDTFDAGANGVGSNPRGFMGAVFDGRHIYFTPVYNGVEFHGEVLRFDTVQGASYSLDYSTESSGLSDSTKSSNFRIATSGGVRGVSYVPYDVNDGLGNSWHNLVGTYNGTNINLYLDGDLVNSENYGIFENIS